MLNSVGPNLQKEDKLKTILVKEGVYKKQCSKASKPYIAKVYTYGTDGLRKKKERHCYTISEAEAWRRTMLAQKDRGEFVTPKTITVGYLAELAISIREDQGHKTINDVKRYLFEDETGIVPFFGRQTPIRNVSEVAIGKWIKMLAERPKRGTTVGNLSPRSIKHRLVMLGSLLNMSFREGWISRLPRMPKLKGANKRRTLPITVRQFKKVADSMEATRRALLWTKFYTGQRWSDVSRMKKNQIKDGRIWYVSSKTNKEGLSIPIPDHLQKVLDEIPTNNTIWLFPNPRTNKPFGSIKNSLRTACERMGVPRFVPHHIRHLSSSRYLEISEGDEDVTCRITGMTKPTLRAHYGHYMDRGDYLVYAISESLGE